MSKQKHNFEANVNRLSDLNFLQRSYKELQLAFWLIQQHDVPILTKLLPIAATLYVIFPFDFIPDILPVLGQLDDVALLMMGIRAFLHLAPPEVVGRYEADKNIIVQPSADNSTDPV